MTDQPFIAFHRPSIGEEEIAEVSRVLRSGWLTTGPKAAQFESEFAASVGSPHALAVNSGTAALHVALAALGVGPGDEVITTPLTFCATVNVILQVGATPVFADVGPDGNLDMESVEAHITPRTRAIIPVHLGGLPCDLDAIWSLAARHNLFVIEDAAHAVSAHHRGAPIGSGRSDAVAFSFYATKSLTTGEGGMVTTPRADLEKAMRVLCLHGISKDAWNRYSENGNWYYEVVACGFKYNLSDVQAAIGIHQLRKQEEFRAARARIAAVYREAFDGVAELENPLENQHCRHAWHLFLLRLNLETVEIDRSQFMRELHHKGIGASVHFIPVPLHPYFRGAAGQPPNQCPRAMELYPRLVSLPIYPALREEEAQYVANSVRDIARSFGRTKSVFLARGARG